MPWLELACDGVQVEGAVELDSSGMSFQQVVDTIVDIIAQQAND
jgi:hypothetical protein